MNERIEDLASQAKFLVEEQINRQISYNNELKAFAEKFAELIVRECADVGSRAMYPDSDPDYVGRKIKKHFGFE